MTVFGSIDVTFSVEDARQVLAGFALQVPAAAEHAIRVVAEALLQDSQLFVPVLTGQLKDSGRVEEVPTIDQAIKVVRVVYGDLETVYARIQHEKPFNHPSLGFYGAAKYLEKPLMLNADFYAKLLVAEYELALIEGTTDLD